MHAVSKNEEPGIKLLTAQDNKSFILVKVNKITLGILMDFDTVKDRIAKEYRAETLDNKTKLGVLKHELLHICFFHLTNWDRFENKKVFNMAADLEINQYIDSDMKGETWDGLEIDGIRFKHLNLEPRKGTGYYYEKLMQEIQNNPDGDIAQMASENGGYILDLDGVEGLSEAEKKLIAKQIDHQLKDVTNTLEKNSFKVCKRNNVLVRWLLSFKIDYFFSPFFVGASAKNF